MSSQNDSLARKQPHLSVSSSSQRASSSTRTRHPRTSRSSTSLLPSQVDLPDPLSDISLDSDPDQRSASSQIDLPAGLSESRPSCFLYPLYKPGQLTAQRIQRLHARTASVIMSIPATCEDIVDVDEQEPCRTAEAPPSKLRRVSGIGDLRRAFRDSGHVPVHFHSISSFGLSESKASHELGILAPKSSSLSHLSPRSSLRTLVDSGNTLLHGSGDLKTLGSTLSSLSIASRFATKVHSTFSPSPRCLPTDAPHPIFPRKYPVHNPFSQSYRRTSLQQDTRPPRSPGEAVWSCAKISQSETKRVARRDHPPRRVFSNPIAIVSS